MTMPALEDLTSSVCGLSERVDAFLTQRVGRLGIVVGGLSLLALALLCGYFWHEPWRDETQAWLMARDMTVAELWRNAGTEGHPIGWHLLLMPLTALGLPFNALRIFNIGLVFLSAGIVLHSRSFRSWQKLVLILTPPFIYFGVYARSYSLVLLLCVLLAASYAARHARPFRYALLLGLLANTLTLFIPYALLLGGWWMYEFFAMPDVQKTRWQPWAAVLFCVLAVLAVVQIIPPSDVASVRMASRWELFLASVNLERMGKIFGFIFVPPLFILPWIIGLVRRDTVLGVITAMAMSFFQFVHMFVYRLVDRHFLACFIIMITTTWVLKVRIEQYGMAAKKFAVIFFCFFAFSMLTCYESGRRLLIEQTELTSNTELVLPFVREHLLDKPVAAHRLLETSPLLAFLPGKQFWSPVTRQWGTYAVFDRNYLERMAMPVDQAAEIVLRDCPAPRPWMIFSQPWANAFVFHYALVFASQQEAASDENYFIYAPDGAS